MINGPSARASPWWSPDSHLSISLHDLTRTILADGTPRRGTVAVTVGSMLIKLRRSARWPARSPEPGGSKRSSIAPGVIAGRVCVRRSVCRLELEPELHGQPPRSLGKAL